MKTEFEIAKENVKKCKKIRDAKNIFHKQPNVRGAMTDNLNMEDVKKWKKWYLKYAEIRKQDLGLDELTRECKTHKATCQKWLEFLEDEVKEYVSDIGELGLMKPIKISEANIKHKRNRLKVIGEKITDLKNTIKLYSENGI